MGTGSKSNLSVSSFQQWQTLTGITIFLNLLIINNPIRHINFKENIFINLSKDKSVVPKDLLLEEEKKEEAYA